MQAAKDLILAAAEAGANAVKFQSFRAEDIALPTSPHYALIKFGALTRDQHVGLASVASECGIAFLSTPFGEWAVDLLQEIGVPAYKVAYMDLTNHLLLERIAETGKATYISTGMATLAEIADSVAFLSARTQGKITLLHCISNYPAMAGDLNLSAIPFLGAEFGHDAGYSDHFPGISACLDAARLGARVIETHFTLVPAQEGGDHAHSASPDQLKELVEACRSVEVAADQGNWIDQRPDRENTKIFRRGVYAVRDLAAGTEIRPEDMMFCRPQSEFSPNDCDALAGKALKRDIARHAPFTRAEIS
jgi:sialic acid synthase SpsE